MVTPARQAVDEALQQLQIIVNTTKTITINYFTDNRGFVFIMT